MIFHTPNRALAIVFFVTRTLGVWLLLSIRLKDNARIPSRRLLSRIRILFIVGHESNIPDVLDPTNSGEGSMKRGVQRTLHPNWLSKQRFCLAVR